MKYRMGKVFINNNILILICALNIPDKLMGTVQKHPSEDFKPPFTKPQNLISLLSCYASVAIRLK